MTSGSAVLALEGDLCELDILLTDSTSLRLDDRLANKGVAIHLRTGGRKGTPKQRAFIQCLRVGL